MVVVQSAFSPDCGGIILGGSWGHFNCWAHGRRKFVEALAINKPRSEYALGQIQKLYAIEQKYRDNGCMYDERKEERQAANPILEQLKDWLDAEAIKVTPRSPIGKAISYLTTDGKSLPNIQVMV